jgi:RNA 3'-phosphate cyclase
LIDVDGSMMEGGGQILRMAITYSAVMGVPVKVRKIRAGRRPPGLQPQHLTTLKAVAEICEAKTKGFNLGSMEIMFTPKPPNGGTYNFDIGTAGSIGLLLQCIAPIAAFSDSTTRLRIKGGTAVRWSPPVRVLDNVVWEALRQMGFRGKLHVLREGFYPRGGGIVEVNIEPIRKLDPIKTESPGEIRLIRGYSLCGRLPRHVAERQASSANMMLEDAGYQTDIYVSVAQGSEAPLSPGSVIGLWADSRPKMFMGESALGERGKPAERVGAEAASSLLEQLKSQTAVDLHTADNLIIWCSLSMGDSTYTTSSLTMHTLTAIELAKIFTNARFNVEGRPIGAVRIQCNGMSLSNPSM